MSLWLRDYDWLVDGNAIPRPTVNTKIEYDSIAASESGRTEDGVMHIAWVRRQITKIHLLYRAIPKSEAAYLLGLLQGKEFSFTYPDPVLGSRTISAYASKSSYDYHTNAVSSGLLTDVSINIIEK